MYYKQSINKDKARYINEILKHNPFIIWDNDEIKFKPLVFVTNLGLVVKNITYIWNEDKLIKANKETLKELSEYLIEAKKRITL